MDAPKTLQEAIIYFAIPENCNKFLADSDCNASMENSRTSGSSSTTRTHTRPLLHAAFRLWI